LSVVHARRATLALCGLLFASSGAHAEVFINELHYDDATASGDTGEGVEVVATAGEDLAAYRVQLYNGSNANAANLYDDRTLPAGGAVSCGGEVRIATLSWPSNGLQNGAADGIALVDGSGALVQCISYEGSVTGADGAAAGHASQDLPVSETNATPAGTSLQLQGNAPNYAGFAWAPSSAATFGVCNNGQSFDSGGDPQPTVTSTTPVNGASDFPAAGDLNVAFSENVALSPGAFALSCSISGAVALSHGSSGGSFAIDTGTALHAAETCTLTIAAASVIDAGGQSPAADTQVGFTVSSGGGGSADYYARVNTASAPQLRCSLHQTIRGHTAYPYSGSGTSTWSILEIADEDPNDSGRVLDVYRNRSYTKGDDRAGTGSGITYNREHTWPNSLGFGSATGDLGLPNAPYTDTHMLYLSDTTYNSDRGNKPYADCPASANCGERTTEVNDGRGGGSGVYPGNSNWVQSPDGNGGSFETWGARKGDLARAVMYMAIRYEGGEDVNSGQSEPDLELTDERSRIVITSSSPAYMGRLSTLLAWHQTDPPDANEAARNEVIYSFQGNRNPFIDHPEWATAELFNSAQPPVCELAQ
jgi:endonuclease I